MEAAGEAALEEFALQRVPQRAVPPDARPALMPSRFGAGVRVQDRVQNDVSRRSFPLRDVRGQTKNQSVTGIPERPETRHPIDTVELRGSMETTSSNVKPSPRRRLIKAATSSTQAARDAGTSIASSSCREVSDAPLHPLSLAEQEREDVRWYPQKSRRHILKYERR
jgi:hypothetical protein